MQPAGPPLLSGSSPRAALPATLRLLCVSAAEPSWTLLALLLDKHGCREPQFRWCDSLLQALTALRDENFDCLIIHDADASLRIAALLEALAADGCTEPVLVLTPPGDDLWLATLCECDCEILASADGWQSPALPQWIARTIDRAHLARENLRLAGADQRRTLRERDETDQLLEQQRRILQDHAESSPLESLRTLKTEVGDELRSLPSEVVGIYQDLLRSYVMMGSGGLAGEIRKLAQLLVLAGLSPGAALHVHLARVEELIRGLGSRSSRHVMSRADLLAMELMIELGECYRQKSQRRGLGDFGIDLLHEESLRQKQEG
ncbi:MAG: hypothetical protein JNG89_03455 [Planctomycetaceae bacterium]|nr:hypothetical protein [Planctomycetaceae bacterium]